MKRMTLPVRLTTVSILLLFSTLHAQTEAFVARYFPLSDLEWAERHMPIWVDASAMPFDPAPPAPVPGFLTITTDEREPVHLFVNHQPIGQTHYSAPSRFEVVPGTYTLEARSPVGECLWETQLSIRAAEIERLHLQRGNEGHQLPDPSLAQPGP